ncbi:DsbA family protein [Dongia soli]|uniref:DsbA family protein n=1 Tax=Dongia soli TaxID=600628 RepID=A0ABU5EBF7_9PROT|nr:DsbA family protein [Dongia soli]MDY0883708.1 DsbA family protein [Dongia soli]
MTRFAGLIICFMLALAAGYGVMHYSGATSRALVSSAQAQSAGSNQAAPTQSSPAITLPGGQVLNAEALGPIIEQYLLDHPEVIVKAVGRLQQKQAAAKDADFQTTIASQQQQLFNSLSSPVLGNPKGDVTMVEFFDYKCPYCKRVADDVIKLIEDDPNVRVVFKEFPILGPDSQVAALAALAANKQGRYSAFHKAAMKHRGAFTKDVVVQIGKDVGLDTDKLQSDMTDPALMAEIEANRAMADKLGIDGTPGFIIGTQKVPGAITLDDMKQLVSKARDQKS